MQTTAVKNERGQLGRKCGAGCISVSAGDLISSYKAPSSTSVDARLPYAKPLLFRQTFSPFHFLIQQLALQYRLQQTVTSTLR